MYVLHGQGIIYFKVLKNYVRRMVQNQHRILAWLLPWQHQMCWMVELLLEGMRRRIDKPAKKGHVIGGEGKGRGGNEKGEKKNKIQKWGGGRMAEDIYVEEQSSIKA